ncbi:hypothetical protein EGC77_14785 [Shewanella psychromarinicola]|uniref:Uncharacterized protein n=1 Tax=Shewanella psychromarinicola TaxID=2487742 RepID=A0A3N4E0R4_9GAMM|nr:hypothetical protein EGC77_14785 [Shewanella psychromarinicola]
MGGTIILSPQHLLYTSVDKKLPSPRGIRLSVEKTNVINRMLVENSHRYVISDRQCSQIGEFHKRLVLPEEVKYELSKWKALNEHHAYNEKEFYSKKYV